MEYNFLRASASQPFFSNNDIMDTNSGYFFQDDIMGFNTGLMDNIDPQLRNNNQRQISQQSWQNNQRPLDRFIDEPERSLFTTGPLFPNPPGSYVRGITKASTPISTLPHATTTLRMVSPSPSQDLTSSDSSARSPPAEDDWCLDSSYYSQPALDSFGFPIATSNNSQAFPSFLAARSQDLNQRTSFGSNCVNPSQVLNRPDLQEVSALTDEGYIPFQSDYALDIGSQGKTQSIEASYYYSDEGIGASIKDEASPHNTSTIHVETADDSDADADGDADDLPVAEEEDDEEPSDTEYKPESRASHKRRASSNTNYRTSPTTQNTKRRRISKSGTKSKGASSGNQLACKQCDHAPFKDQASLQRHTASSHTRSFVCVFDFAGCESTFTSKNEWKRHVSSQHLNLSSWICEIGACAKYTRTAPSRSHNLSGGRQPEVLRGSEFNRKDLFTQHLRRMHTPAKVKGMNGRMSKKNEEWEETLKELQVTCLKVKRQAPNKLRCPVKDCEMLFEGSTCWDERMEHVGKHLEKTGPMSASGNGKVLVRQGDDDLLVRWALREGIIAPERTGGYVLLAGVGHTHQRATVTSSLNLADVDAECEEE